jgi:spermidine synthase
VTALTTDVLAAGTSERGELLLLRRHRDQAIELRVNGVFVMDTLHTGSERQLARSALAARVAAAPIDPTGLRVLVGGLGLGFTLAEILASSAVGQVIVAEIEPDLVRWHRDDTVGRPNLLADPRVEVAIADVRDVLADQPANSLDLVVLDVDNGPNYLVYEDNAEVYRHQFLRTVHGALSEDGVLAIWSADASPSLAENVSSVFATMTTEAIEVTLGQRVTDYQLYVGRR